VFWFVGASFSRPLVFSGLVMNTRNPRHVLAFAFLVGVFFYLAGAVWSAYFIIALPQAEGWCKDWVEPHPDAGGSGFSGCVGFKNDVEESKYYHNKQMLARNTKWIYATIGAAILLSLLLFWYFPNRIHHRQVPRDAFVTATVLGFIAALIVPMILSWMLPAPSTWFPKFIVEAAQQREADALRRIIGDPFPPAVVLPRQKN
jgi:hypothetical protein